MINIFSELRSAENFCNAYSDQFKIEDKCCIGKISKEAVELFLSLLPSGIPDWKLDLCLDEGQSYSCFPVQWFLIERNIYVVIVSN